MKTTPVDQIKQKAVTYYNSNVWWNGNKEKIRKEEKMHILLTTTQNEFIDMNLLFSTRIHKQNSLKQ
jgi:hypothetical protein